MMLSNSVSTPSRSWTMSYLRRTRGRCPGRRPPCRRAPPVQNGPQLLKTAAYFAALACHGLQQHRRGLSWLQNLVQALADEANPLVDALLDVRAGWKL